MSEISNALTMTRAGDMRACVLAYSRTLLLFTLVIASAACSTVPAAPFPAEKPVRENPAIVTPSTPPPSGPELPPLPTEKLDAALQHAVDAHQLPGAVLVVVQDDEVRYHRAVGLRTHTPIDAPMSEDTVFDIASLTKVVCTTPAVLQLVDEHKLDLDAHVVKYWPTFGAHGKDRITVRDLLTHYSGFQQDLYIHFPWQGMARARRMIEELPLVAPVGTRYLYSDINFATLGELVRIASGEPIDTYCERHVFAPLGMKHTAYGGERAAGDDKLPIAPTSADPNRLGKVHDPTAYRMGGKVGHAGVFSTADDLQRWVHMLLHNGRANGAQVLSEDAVRLMETDQTRPGSSHPHGLGLDLAATHGRNELVPFGRFGHTGYTGTAIWMDPDRRMAIILLTNRVYPDGSGHDSPLRNEIAALLRAPPNAPTADSTAAANAAANAATPANAHSPPVPQR